jgi:radical SAM superfamily enzyme YgiQ (UPF0313 family)/anti-anti-sigma regulatory factor
MKKLLLTTVFRPFGVNDYYGNSTTLAEFHHTNLTSAQGVFSIRGANPNVGLRFIAENLEIPTVVLENPSIKEFKKHLKKGYDYVGINFSPTTYDKAKKMCELSKEISPQTKTVIGGYGTAVAAADKIADYVCRGEGVQFFRDLLGETQDRPLKHPTVINPGGKTMGIQLGKGGVIATGLGCPRGCEFCLTSHYYNCKHLPLLNTGDEIFQAMMDCAQGMPLKKRSNSRDFLIIEEDFLLNKKRVEELAVFTKEEIAKPVAFSCFGAADSIMQYDFDELAAMGLDCVWLGVESPQKEYKKLKNIDLKKLIGSLHEHGIMTITSMVLGYDFHTEETIWQDIDYLLSMESTFNQFMLYTPLQGTPLYNMASKENRILDLPWKDFDGFHFTMKHPNFTPQRMEEIQREAFALGFHKLGPSIFRSLMVNFKAYQRFKHSSSPILKRRAAYHRDTCCYSLPLFPAAIKYAPNKEIQNKLTEQQNTFCAEFGSKTVTQIASIFVSTKLALKVIKEELFPYTPQPKLVKKSYRMSPRELISVDLLGGARDKILNINVREIEKIQALLVKCRGHLNTMTAKKVNKRLTAFLERNSSVLVLDFGEISHIDLSAIKDLLNKLEKYRRRIKIIFEKSQVEKVINRLEGKVPSFEIFYCWEELIASFA